MLLHHALRRNGADDVDRSSTVVPLTVPRAAGDQRVVVGDARALRCFGQAVDIAHEADDGAPGSPRRDVAGRHAGTAHLDLEAFLAKDVGDVLGGQVFLKTEFGEREDAVDHDLRQLLHGRHLFEGFVLELLAVGRLRRRGRGRRGHGNEQGRNEAQGQATGDGYRHGEPPGLEWRRGSSTRPTGPGGRPRSGTLARPTGRCQVESPVVKCQTM